MIGYPLDSHVTYDTDGTPQFDRAITSEPLRKLYKTLFNEGILPDVSTNMQVIAGTGMSVTIQPGFALCNGCQKLTTTAETLALGTADATLPRIDTVVLRLDDNDAVRSCEFAILRGTPASSPSRPVLTRSESIYEIGLADIRVGANVSQISNSNILDTRYDVNRCGVISSISQFDTSTLNNQMTEWVIEQQADFEIWVESIKNILDATTAGKLQNEIDELKKIVHLAIEYDPSLAGATITATNGLETYSAMANALGITEFDAMSMGIWVISEDKYGSGATIATNFHGNYSATIGGDRFINVVYASDFEGKTITATNGTDTQSRTASGGTVQFCFANDGTYEISSVVGGKTYKTSVKVNGAGTYNATLQTSSTISVTVYSAAADTVYYYPDNDTSKSPITLCTTDTTGKAENVSITFLPGDSLTLYSTVAKDTTSGTTAYRKNVSLSESLSEISVMPSISDTDRSNMVYWYGFSYKELIDNSYGYPPSYPYPGYKMAGINTNYIGITYGTASSSHRISLGQYSVNGKTVRYNFNNSIFEKAVSSTYQYITVQSLHSSSGGYFILNVEDGYNSSIGERTIITNDEFSTPEKYLTFIYIK